MRNFARLALAVIAGAAGANAQSLDASHMVFFDWGKSELTSDATATLDKLAAEIVALPNARVRVTGHSDRSGPSGFNLRASRQRATLVADYLAGKGVPRKAMTIDGVGESEPLVPTQDGVREVQNRRVVISVQP